jgi:hypothetical protein
MSALTIPNTFAADQYLRSDKLQANFAAIRSFLNDGKLTSSNFAGTARIQNKQLAEPRSVSVIAVTFLPSSHLSAVAQYSFPLLARAKVTHIRTDMALAVTSPKPQVRVWQVTYTSGASSYAALYVRATEVPDDNRLTVRIYLAYEHVGV